MSGDTNVHRVVGNLLVGTSHFFVDTTTNQVGVNTSTPSAALDVASGDLKVGSDITLASGGTITAANFSGNGSGLSDINSDSGSWVKDDANSKIYVANSAHKVAIGTTSVSELLTVGNDGVNADVVNNIRLNGRKASADGEICGLYFANSKDTGDGTTGSSASIRASRIGGSNFATQLDFYTNDGAAVGSGTSRLTIGSGGNVGINTTSPTKRLEINSGYQSLGGYIDTYVDIGVVGGMILGTKQSGGTHVPALYITDSGYIGIGTSSPGATLDVAAQHGNIASPMVHFRANRDGASNGDGNVLLLENSGNRSDVELLECKSSGNTRFVVKANGDVDINGRTRVDKDGVVAEYVPVSSGSYTLMNFWSKVNYGSDRGFILVQDESANLPGSSSEDLRMTVGVHNDFRSSGLHSDELWLQGGGRLCYNVGAWDSELNSIIGTPGTGSDHGGVKHEWRIANSQKMHLNSSGTLNVSGEIEAAAFTTRNTGSFSYNYDGVFMRPDGQVYISVDDNFYFRDNQSTSSSDRRHLFDTNAGHAYHEGTMHQNHNLDYAEYFEWFDGNPGGEDRIGYSVSLVENTNKIKKCEPGEIPLGVVSGTSSVVGGVAGIYWTGYWKNDEWGRPTYTQLKDDNGELVFNEDGTPKMKRAKNPDYDETLSDTYLPRNKRKEWACVGLLGQVYIRKGCIKSPYWRKIKNVDDVKEYWFINPVFPDTQLEKNLTETKSELATTRADLTTTKTQLDEERTQLRDTQTELEVTKLKLANVEARLKILEVTISS